MRRLPIERIPRLPTIILGVLLFGVLHVNAATLKVPQDYPTIQAGIDAAADGDTVFVAPGTYVESIDFSNKGITVASSAGPAVTIIDAGQNRTAVSIRAPFGQQQKPCSLQGFTVRNAAGLSGTAIDIWSTSPLITGNIIEGNSISGIGATVTDGSSAVIERNLFRNFSCETGCGEGVLNLYVIASPEITNNLFLNNACPGISIWADVLAGGSPRITNNTVVGNAAGIAACDLYIHPTAARPVIGNNLIWGNDQGFASFDYGASIDEVIWQNNLVYANTANYSGIPDQSGTNGNISTDPLLFDPANNDFHLSYGSSAISAGNATSIDPSETDFDGKPRLTNGKVDIGAYEFDSGAPLRVSIQGDSVSGLAPLTVNFTTYATGPVTGYKWDFGDGKSSTLAHPTHTFGAGTYTVRVNVSGPSRTAAAGKALVQSYNLYTVTASASTGGSITPEGTTMVKGGDALSYTVTPNPNCRLSALIVDEKTIGGPSTSPLTYAFNSVSCNHTITAVFSSIFDYFGLQAGNHQESLLYYPGGIQTQTDDISLDTSSFPQPSYVDQQVLAGSVSESWFQELANGLFMQQEQSSGKTMTFSPPLPYIKTPLLAKSHWTATSTLSYKGHKGTSTITAKVSSMTAVRLPAGEFEAWQITYTLNASGSFGSSSTVWTDFFVPYVGTVMTYIGRSASSEINLSAFKIAGGTVTAPPPVIDKIQPASGKPGDFFGIQGCQFGTSRGKVRIGSLDCITPVWSDSLIQCVVPEGALSGPVSVVTDTWTSASDAMIFSVLPYPQFKVMMPSSGKTGSMVQILGANLGTAPGQVQVGLIPAKVGKWLDSAITFTVPAGLAPGSYSISVTFPQQSERALTATFTVL